MKRAWPTTAKILTGFFVTAMYAMPQAYTISAKPGVVNYIEGNAFLNGRPIETQNLKTTFLNANDTISTDIGKAEVLLSPGVFLRLGVNTQVRMVSPSLTDTQIELKAGEAMVEADDILKDNRVTVIDAGNTVVVERSGLYKFSAGDAPKVAVLEGKLDVYDGDRKTEVGKGHEFLLGQAHKTEKFDAKKGDDLYAWSSVRSQYNAASSYQAAKDVNASSYGGVWGDFGFSGFANPGWMWNSGLQQLGLAPWRRRLLQPIRLRFLRSGHGRLCSRDLRAPVRWRRWILHGQPETAGRNERCGLCSGNQDGGNSRERGSSSGNRNGGFVPVCALNGERPNAPDLLFLGL